MFLLLPLVAKEYFPPEVEVTVGLPSDATAAECAAAAATAAAVTAFECSIWYVLLTLLALALVWREPLTPSTPAPTWWGFALRSNALRLLGLVGTDSPGLPLSLGVLGLMSSVSSEESESEMLVPAEPRRVVADRRFLCFLRGRPCSFGAATY